MKIKNKKYSILLIGFIFITLFFVLNKIFIKSVNSEPYNVQIYRCNQGSDLNMCNILSNRVKGGCKWDENNKNKPCKRWAKNKGKKICVTHDYCVPK